MLVIPDKHISLSGVCFSAPLFLQQTQPLCSLFCASRSVSLKGRLQPLLEFAIGKQRSHGRFFDDFYGRSCYPLNGIRYHNASVGILIVLPSFLLKMTLGIGLGYLFGRLAVWFYNKIDFEYNGLYYVLGIVVVLISYAVTELAQGNGFMAVYATGMVMGNRRFVFHNGIGRFYDGLAWMMQVILFTMLGLLAFPSQVWHAKWIGFAVFLMRVARPLATFIGMWRSRFSVNERLLVSWVGLRGGAPIMLATFPLMAEISNSDLMFHIVFFIVLTSVLLQGMTIMPMAKLLKLDAPLRKNPRMPLSIEDTGRRCRIERNHRFRTAQRAKTCAIATSGWSFDIADPA